MDTPFQQATHYATELPYSQRPRWIVVCNFRSWYVYNVEQPNDEPQVILLKNFHNPQLRYALVKGEIAISRYESYLSLLGDCAENKYR